MAKETKKNQSAGKQTITKKSKSVAQTKSKSKGSVRSIKPLRETVSSPTEIREVSRKSWGFLPKLIIIVAVGVALYLVAQKYRGLIVAGTVNSSPIYRWDMNKRMTEKYGKQTLDEIVSEKILQEQLKKNNIEVSDAEVQGEMDKIIQEYGGEEAFKTALTQFGLTEAKARESIEQSLGLKKLIESKYTIEITDEAVAKYYEDNKATFEDKKLDEVSGEIKDTLYQQELYAKTQEWFTEVREEAKVVSYI